MPTHADICREARTWLGTPWRHRQCLKGHGVDCTCLLWGVARSLGLVDPAWRPPQYSPSFHLHSSRELVSEVLLQLGATPVPLAQHRCGTILLFQFGRSCAHAAIALPEHRIIHAVRHVGYVVETGLTGEWQDRVRRAYQFPGLEPS
jgi:NlpC/P60 family putative phage cell wall peptidase